MLSEKIILISDNELLSIKLKFALSLVELTCLSVPSFQKMKILNQRDAAAIFLDRDIGISAAVDFAFKVKSNQYGKKTIPVFLLQCGLDSQEHCNEYAVFDDILPLPLLRRNLYRMLHEHGIIKKQEVRITPFLYAVSDGYLPKFLEQLKASQDSILPSFDNEYHYPQVDRLLPGDRMDNISILLNLYSKGMLERELFDRIHQCPHCSGCHVNFRECCPQCFSIDFIPTEMLHHYPCGYVGDSTDFKRSDSDELICPKCDKVLRHIGMDYEKPISSYLCHSCGMHFTISAVRCRCFNCATEFEPSQAVIKNFYSYRLKPGNIKSYGGTSNGDDNLFSVSREAFTLLLQQNLGISKELGFSVQLIAVDTSWLREAERWNFMRMFRELKRSSDVIYMSPEGRAIIIVFYHSLEEVKKKVAEFESECKKSPVLGKRKMSFRIYRFNDDEKINAEKIIDKIINDFEMQGEREE